MATYESADYGQVEFTDDRTGESERVRVKIDSCDDDRRALYG